MQDQTTELGLLDRIALLEHRIAVLELDRSKSAGAAQVSSSQPASRRYRSAAERAAADVVASEHAIESSERAAADVAASEHAIESIERAAADIAASDHAIESIESKLGTYWLSRIGIISVITGTALLVITYFGALATLARIGLGYAMAGAVAWLGLRLARRHRTFGEIVFGGGLAIAYFVTYALHFVPAMRVVDNQVAGIALVGLAIAGVVVVAHRMKSETVAGIALFLGLHTGMLSEVTTLSLVAATLLAAGAGFFLAANRWVVVPLTTVVAVYSTHASLAFDGATDADLRLAFVIVDCALFVAASSRHPELRLVRALAGVNWLGAFVLGGAALADRSTTAVFAGGALLALAYGAIAAVAWWRRVAPAYVALHAGIAIATLALALPARLDGAILVASWLALAALATVIARRGDARFGVLAALLLVAAYAGCHEARLGWPAMFAVLGVAFAIERLHAPTEMRSRLRLLLVAGLALGLLDIAHLAVPSGLRTLATVGVGSLLFAVGFALAAQLYRAAAFVVLGAAVLRLLSVELGMFSPGQRILTFVLGGVALLVVSFVYHRRRAR